ncbi:MAG: ATP-binding protein [Gammaproteobacteria bacterium]|nr:ATP-binding protein [Gammaproteobacteria bacterium]
MRWLVASLFGAIIFATVGLGWLFDTLYMQYQNDASAKQKDAIGVMEQLGSEFANLLNVSENPSQFLANWNPKSEYQLTLKSLDDLPLPEPLYQKFIEAKPIVLETQDHIDINFYLSNHQQRMVLTAPITNFVPQSKLGAYLFTGLFYLTLLLLMTVWLYPLVKRLLSLRSAAKAFGEGKLDQRIELGSVSYIRDLEFEFNRMAQRIDDLVSDVKLLSSAVSHDLRTPLASIRFGIDTLQEEDDPVLRKKFEQRISNDADAMIELVETLLNYARLDQAMLQIDKSNVELVPLLQQIIEAKQNTGKCLNLFYTDAEQVVNADKRYLLMMLNNLIQNAVQYSVSKVHISLSQNEHEQVIVIADDGNGISEQDRDNMLKPFVRGDKTRSSVKGFGIGLAIVTRILHWHNGRIEITHDDDLSGAKFTVYLPL